MANKPTGSITLPLLDRLTDEDPKRGEEVPLSRSKSLAALKVAVRRDLEWLLNTRRAERELPPEVARSVFSYGLPEESSGSEDRSQVFQALARRMETAIAVFEPRLAGVKVTLSPHQDATIRRVDLIIEGLLRIDPSPEHVSFDTSLELTSGEYHVKDLLKVDTTPVSDMPADEVSNGFDNDSGVLTVSSLHAEKYVLVSEALAKAAVQNLSALTTCDTTAQGEDACALAFAKSFGRRAFRRPTTPNDEQALMAAYAAGKTGGSYAEGIEVMIRAALQSPDFVYRLETTTPANSAAALVPLSQFELATRLSYMIWASGPDDALLDAAQNGALASKEQVAAKAREMLNDPRAKLGLANFFNEWSGVTRLSITTKNTTLFPNYSDDLRDAMARELPAFMQYVLYQGDHTLRTLLTSPLAFVSGPLGSVYGLSNAPTGTTPTQVTLPDGQGRSGLLTQAGFLSVQGHPDQTSPVLRGKFVRAMLLCDPVPAPPPTVNTSLPTVDQGATARERFSAHATDSSCKGCHSLMDPIGFAFENFDAMGQYRTTDNGETIDASGVINDPADPNLGGNFTGVRGLAEKLVNSSQVSDCMATQWFRYASGRLEAEPDNCSLAQLRGKFSSSGGDLVELVVGMTQTDDFWYRAPVTQ